MQNFFRRLYIVICNSDTTFLVTPQYDPGSTMDRSGTETTQDRNNPGPKRHWTELPGTEMTRGRNNTGYGTESPWGRNDTDGTSPGPKSLGSQRHGTALSRSTEKTRCFKGMGRKIPGPKRPWPQRIGTETTRDSYISGTETTQN